VSNNSRQLKHSRTKRTKKPPHCEAAVADTELQLLDAQYKYFFYRAIYETAKTGTVFE
jgi:hypothetical protein